MILEEKGGATPRGLLDIHSTVFERDAVNALGVSGRMGGGVGWGWLVCGDVQKNRCLWSLCFLWCYGHTQPHSQNTDRKGSIQGPIHTIWAQGLVEDSWQPRGLSSSSVWPPSRHTSMILEIQSHGFHKRNTILASKSDQAALWGQRLDHRALG